MKNRKNQFAIDRPRCDGCGFMAAYFPVNDPLVPLSILSAYELARVDAIELGMKSDNPYADGEIVAASMRRSSGIGSIAEAGKAIQRVRNFEHDTLGMIFAYAEPRLSVDAEAWLDVDALLCLGNGGIVADQLELNARERGTRITKFVPYDLPEEAVVQATTANGFVMLQYTSGKTGLRTSTDRQLPERLSHLRRNGIVRPVLTGIGVSTPDQVRQAMDSGADGIVVGSMAIQKAEEGCSALEDYLCKLRDILDGD